jgi:hypothetical protein
VEISFFFSPASDPVMFRDLPVAEFLRVSLDREAEQSREGKKQAQACCDRSVGSFTEK